MTFLHYITSPQGPHLSNVEHGVNESGLFNSEILGLLFLEPKAPRILNDCRGLWLQLVFPDLSVSIPLN